MDDGTTPEVEAASPTDGTTPEAEATSPTDRTTPAAETTSPTAEQVRLALRKVKDPELNLNVVDLGLIYEVAVESGRVKVDMSLTSPGCPSGPEIMQGVEQQARTVPGVEDVNVNLVWSPMWSPDRIEPRIRAYLGF